MKTLLTVSLVLLAAVLVLLLADTIPMLRRWLSRIHIGQWEDEEEWKTKVEKSLLKQLRHAPSSFSLTPYSLLFYLLTSLVSLSF